MRSVRVRVGLLLLALALPAADGRSAETVLAANSVHTRFPGGWYDELYVFPEWAREFSPRTLYGYSVREDTGPAVRDYRVMRLQTTAPYLWTSDLFSGAELRTTSNTILFLFPRDPREGPFLYRMLEEPGGLLRLEGPGGIALGFDARTHRLRGTLGLTVEPPVAIGVPPRITARSLHLKLESAGQSPFLRGAPAEIRDAEGRSCRLTTDEVFAFRGDESESDELRWDTDDVFFEFLAARCPTIHLPPLSSEVRMAQRDLVRRAAVAAAAAAAIPTPAPRPLRTERDAPEPEPTRKRGEFGPEDGGFFEFLGGIFR